MPFIALIGMDMKELKRKSKDMIVKKNTETEAKTVFLEPVTKTLQRTCHLKK